MRVCVLKNCNDNSRVWGFCPRHFYLFVDKQRLDERRRGFIGVRKDRLCVLLDCNKKHFAYGFCDKHYYLFIGKQMYDDKKPDESKNFKVYSIDPGEYVQFKVDPIDTTQKI